MASASFFAIVFLWRPVVDNLRLKLCLFASEEIVFASIQTMSVVFLRIKYIHGCMNY